MIQVAHILLRKGKAYLPTEGQVEGGGAFVQIDPVLITEIASDAIAEALAQIAAIGHPTIPNILRDEWKQRKDPLLTATRVRSWSALARTSASYNITWESHQITLMLHALDAKGRFAATPERAKIFTESVSLRELAEHIVTDVAQLPQLGFVDVRV